MKKWKRWRALLLTGVITLTMCLGSTAFATDEEDAPDVGAKVTKVLEMAEGITVPNATFSFMATAVTDDAPSASIADITYTGDDTADVVDGKISVSRTGDITFGTAPKTGAAAFLHAGVYEYTVVETQNTYTAQTGESMTYSQDQYTMYVYVANKDQGDDLEIVSITAEKDGVKQEAISFVNTYTKRGGFADAASLTISKTVDGKYGNRSKLFDFTITFTKAATANDTTYTGKIGNTEVICTVGEAEDFQLAHGQSLVFDNLPAGTRYVVTEAGAAGYTPEVTVVENGGTGVVTKGSAGEDLSTAAAGKTNLVGEKTNSAAYENKYPTAPTTGVVMDNLPFVILIAAAVFGLIALIAWKRRKSFVN